MKKWILIGAGAVVVIIIVGVIMIASNLGPIIKKAVNTYGPDITKTKVSLGGADVSLFSANASLKDLFVGNPKGFTSPYAMKVGDIMVAIDKKSITGNPIIIDRIEVLSPKIDYEKAKGTDNFQTILNNVKSSVGAEKQPANKQSNKQAGNKKTGKKILIRDFLLKGGEVTLTMPVLGGKSISAPLPEIHLKNIGEKKGGASPAEAFHEVFQSLYAKITSPAVTDALTKKLKSIGIDMNALGSGATKQLESVGKGTEQGAEGITKKLKGILGQ